MTTKKQLMQAVDKTKKETKEALQLLYGNINKGQRKQITKRAEIQELFNRYGVEYDD